MFAFLVHGNVRCTGADLALRAGNDGGLSGTAGNFKRALFLQRKRKKQKERKKERERERMSGDTRPLCAFTDGHYCRLVMGFTSDLSLLPLSLVKVLPFLPSSFFFPSFMSLAV